MPVRSARVPPCVVRHLEDGESRAVVYQPAAHLGGGRTSGSVVGGRRGRRPGGDSAGEGLVGGLRHRCRCWPAGTAGDDESGGEGGDAEPARKEEGPGKPCRERVRRCRTGPFQDMGVRARAVARIARPSEPPTWRAVLSRPEARPASERPTPIVAAAASGGKSTPREKATTIPGPRTALQ